MGDGLAEVSGPMTRLLPPISVWSRPSVVWDAVLYHTSPRARQELGANKRVPSPSPWSEPRGEGGGLHVPFPGVLLAV